MNVSVIIATYNMPEWLEKVLWGYECQTYDEFEIVIADDGSSKPTKEIIDRFKKDSILSIQHLWHEDKGYMRQTILNKAIQAAKYDNILLTDRDCIPRKDFIQVHVELSEKDRFLSGGYCKLPMPLSKACSEEDIKTQRCFNGEWLKKNGLSGTSQLRKINAGSLGKFFDTITPANASFNNCNTSAWKRDLIQVNGYDERMRYGGPDREIGERLENLGVKGKQIRHRAICLHLDHSRGYKTPESIQRNLEIRKNTRKNRITQTEYGITQNAT